MIVRTPLRSIGALLALTTLASSQQTSPASAASSPIVCQTSGDRNVASPPSPPAPDQAAEEQDRAEASSGSPVLAPQEHLPNFTFARTRLKHYANCDPGSGCYWTDVKAQTDAAQAQLSRLLGQHHAQTPAEAKAKKLALVLDIDDTSITGFCEQRREDYGYIPALFDTWVHSPESSVPVPGTLELFRQARAAGVAVFFITGRANDLTAMTVQNLHRAGFEGWTGLVLRADDELDLTAKQYKSAERAKIVAAGYSIILSVGDQWSDLLGTPRAEVSIKLPNPFYYLP